jgi:hypothetical protein
MARKRCFISILIFFAFAAASTAGDISGKWIAPVENSDVEMVFKVKGNTLNGTVNSLVLGKAKIKYGKVVGKNIYFILERKIGKDEATTIWNGTVEGEAIKFTRTIRGGEPLHTVAIRAQAAQPAQPANESGK